MSMKPCGPGHNSGDAYIDPGPATDYFDRGPIAQYPQFDTAAVSDFYSAVRSSGDEAIRHRAIDRAFARARENAALSANALRIFHRICENAHGRYRYSTEPHERLAAYCSFSSASNFHRYVRELIDLGFLARFEFHRHGGGHPYPIYAPVCTANDRSGLTDELLRRKAHARRVSPRTPQAFLTEEPIRQNDEMANIDLPAKRQDDELVNSSKRRVATRQNDDPNYCIKTSREDSPYSPPRGADGLLPVLDSAPPPAPAPSGGSSEGPGTGRTSKRDPDALDAAFEEFWRVYPPGRKQAKGDARDVFRKIVLGRHRRKLRATPEVLIEGARRYAATRPNPDYTPMPSTWLNGGRWEDNPGGGRYQGSRGARNVSTGRIGPHARNVGHRHPARDAICR